MFLQACMEFSNAFDNREQSSVSLGISKTLFAPRDTITHEQLAEIIQRYGIYKGLDTVVSKTTSYFDNEKISDYTEDAVAFCTLNEIMLGKSGNLFDPQGTATRAEVSAVLHRFMELMTSR